MYEAFIPINQAHSNYLSINICQSVIIFLEYWKLYIFLIICPDADLVTTISKMQGKRLMIQIEKVMKKEIFINIRNNNSCLRGKGRTSSSAITNLNYCIL